MLTFLPGPLVAVFGLLSYLLITVFFAVVVLLVLVLRYLIPIKAWHTLCDDWLHERLFNVWVVGCNVITWLITRTQWEVRGKQPLDPKGWYFLISNHQSWLDIIVLEKVFARKIPTIKFFMKRELLWGLPIAGLACWAMGFPFMRRYTKEYLRKHPEKTGRDIESTKRACEKFKDRPVTVMNYVEGTRITTEKQAKSASPYQHLLRPRAGGVAFVLQVMDDHIHKIINVTVIYPLDTTFWGFACNRVKKIIVEYEVIPITEALRGDYYKDKVFRVRFQKWLNQLWKEKDQSIDLALKNEE